MMKRIGTIALVITSLCMSQTALAQNNNESATVEGNGNIHLPTSEIEGKRQLPGALYILQNDSLAYERIDTQRSFLKKIDESTSQDPF